MNIKELLAKIIAKAFVWKIERDSKNPIQAQKKVFQNLIHKGKLTSFGKDQNFESIKTHRDFVNNVRVKDYEGLKPYFDRLIKGEANVLWPGKPIYLAKTSGTTSGVKYIPITKESMPSHINASRDAMFFYINETGKTEFLNKKVIFLQGSPVLEEINGIKLGRLSGIVAHFTPKYLKNNISPSWEVNCIEDWEEKVREISKETIKEDMAVIGGIPPWVQMYFESLKRLSKKNTVKEIFPSFQLFVYGGVNFEPYRKMFNQYIGKKIDSIEYFPASEGFFAYQNSQKSNELLLQINSGIFYEFIKLDEMKLDDPTRYTVKNVEKETNYVMIISTNAGLWAYNTGDTVAFTSLYPHKIKVTGRYKHFISAFGEHVIGSEVENALKKAIESFELKVNEFTVAPVIKNKVSLPFHQWWIEFDNTPKKEEIERFAKVLDKNMQAQNTYYKDLITGKVLKQLEVVILKKETFRKFMKNKGKLGGQNKLPRLSNDRKIVDEIERFSDFSPEKQC